MYIFGGQAVTKSDMETLYLANFFLEKSAPAYLYIWEKIRTENPKARDSSTCIYVSALPSLPAC